MAARELTPIEVLDGKVEAGTPLTEHVVVFEMLFGRGDPWWMWCYMSLHGAGFHRIRYSRPFALESEVVDTPPPGRAANARGTLVMQFDTPYIPPAV